MSQHEVQEPRAGYARNKEIPTFFGEPLTKGSFEHVDVAQSSVDIPSLFYTHPNGEVWRGDALAWLRSLERESADLVFADPPYNIKKAE